jgi:apolipoprotein N-acyltransferase
MARNKKHRRRWHGRDRWLASALATIAVGVLFLFAPPLRTLGWLAIVGGGALLLVARPSRKDDTGS